MKALKLSFSLLLVVFLSGCLHIQLFGTVGSAVIVIAELRNPDTTVDSGASINPEDGEALRGEETWISDGPIIQLFWVGIYSPPQEAFNPQTLYLATASGGEDFDVDLDREIDESGTTVSGSWHAIMTGEQISGLDGKISPLTDLIYRKLNSENISSLSDEEVLARMDELAADLVPDLDEDGDIDYRDVLLWNRLLNSESLTADAAMLTAYTQAITDGASDDELNTMADAFFGGGNGGGNMEGLAANSGIYETTTDFYNSACSDGSSTPVLPTTLDIEVVVDSNGALMYIDEELLESDGVTYFGDSGTSGTVASDGSFTATRTVKLTVDGFELLVGEQEVIITTEGMFTGDSWSGTVRIFLDIQSPIFNLLCDNTTTFSGPKIN